LAEPLELVADPVRVEVAAVRPAEEEGRAAAPAGVTHHAGVQVRHVAIIDTEVVALCALTVDPGGTASGRPRRWRRSVPSRRRSNPTGRGGSCRQRPRSTPGPGSFAGPTRPTPRGLPVPRHGRRSGTPTRPPAGRREQPVAGRRGVLRPPRPGRAPTPP